MKGKDQEIGEIIKDWIEVAGYTQADIANDLKISRITFSAQLNGRKSMPIERINKLVEWFNPPDNDVQKIKSLIAKNATRSLNLPKSANAPAGSTESANVPDDAELEILKRDAKIAQCVLQIAYLERKVKRLQELNGFR